MNNATQTTPWPGLSMMLLATVALVSLGLGGCAPAYESATEEPNAGEAAEEEAEADTELLEAELTDVREKAEEAAEVVRSYTYQQHDQFSVWATAQIETINMEVRQIDTAIDELGETKTRWEETLRQLEARRQAITTELNEAMAATEQDWEQAKTQAADAIDALARSASEALDRLSVTAP